MKSEAEACSFPSDRCLSPPLRVWEKLCKEIGEEWQQPVLPAVACATLPSPLAKRYRGREWTAQF